MFPSLPGANLAEMNIRLRIERSEPPCGDVSAEDGTAIPFSGWLELLRILSDLLAQAGDPGETPLP